MIAHKMMFKRVAYYGAHYAPAGIPFVFICGLISGLASVSHEPLSVDNVVFLLVAATLPMLLPASILSSIGLMLGARLSNFDDWLLFLLCGVVTILSWFVGYWYGPELYF